MKMIKNLMLIVSVIVFVLQFIDTMRAIAEHATEIYED